MSSLGVQPPDHEPYATRYVHEIVGMIERLVWAGHAYVVGDGVYFAVKSFARYGALSGRNVDELLVGARIAPGEEKRDPLDFALWKFAKTGEPSWRSPWGEGRPGWHIECSAMAHALLGEPFDIHGGGHDLLFPHHENEVAQSESLLTQPPMVNVWMHGGLLMFDGKKMSKSLGNFEPLWEVLQRHDPQAIRLLFLQTGYRKPMNFTESSIDGATTALSRLLEAYDRLRHAPPSQPRANAMTHSYRPRFIAALNDDLNTAAAVSVLFDLARESSALIEAGEASIAAAFLHEAMDRLGISPTRRTLSERRPPAMEAPDDLADRIRRLQENEEMMSDCNVVFGAKDLRAADVRKTLDALIVARGEAKRERDFARADRIRDALAAEGITLVDGRDGTTTWTAAAR